MSAYRSPGKLIFQHPERPVSQGIGRYLKDTLSNKG